MRGLSGITSVLANTSAGVCCVCVDVPLLLVLECLLLLMVEVDELPCFDVVVVDVVVADIPDVVGCCCVCCECFRST